MMPAQTALAIRASRTEFARVFWIAQSDAKLDPSQRQPFEAVGRSGVDAEAFEQALRLAETQGWLTTLELAIVEARLEDGSILRALVTARAAEGRSDLQAIVNNANGFAEPEIAWRGVTSGMRWTVRVLIDGIGRGTGLLVGPHLVLTAWHVVRELFDVDANGDYQPIPDAAQRLHVEFDNFLALVGNGQTLTAANTLRIAAHNKWCVVFSACHQDELHDALPADLRELDHRWDYAVLRLAKTPGAERRWLSLDAVQVPKVSGDIYVFQHPAAQPLRLATGQIVAPAVEAAAAVPSLRFLHAANALPGSSGGPCFDKSFLLFGVHQGAWTRNGHTVNRGVPIMPIRDDIRQQITTLPVPDAADCAIWQLGAAPVAGVTSVAPGDPVIGCDEFQRLVWRSALLSQPRVITVSGETGSGKTFRAAVLGALLPDDGHLKIVLDARTISKLDAAKLAATICNEAGATMPALAPPADTDSTPVAWSKDVVLPDLVRALDAVRRSRLVWLVLTELNKTSFQGKQASELLLAIYELTRTTDWLRVVLDGMSGDIPDSIQLLTERTRNPSITPEDVLTYLRRAIVALQYPFVDQAARVLAVVTYDDYQTALNTSPAEAVRRLARRALQALQQYLRGLQPGGA